MLTIDLFLQIWGGIGYLLAKNNPIGWLLFALMCTGMGILMLVQDKTLLVFQQGISLIVVIAGYIRAVKKSK